MINKEVVSLTNEQHSYTHDDEQGMRRLLVEVEKTANDEERDESIIQKVSLLIFRTASGQYFYEGNKRTALVAAQSFLDANKYAIDMKDKDLEKVVDKASIGQADLSKVTQSIRRLIRNVQGRT
ncbi:MAG TPA: Fic family protein [Candidatus Bathyarchaeia archaeon]|nr:Fic family protein [Candidatus Bathyarchaeia archaeon]